MTLTEQSFQLENLKLQAITTGEINSPVVLCLHGWLDNAASFLPLFKHLPNYYLVAVDWPGHGLSQHRSAGAYYHFIDWVSDLLELFENNSWQQVHIVAHSMGAMVASAFAAAFPEKVASLTLIDSLGFNVEAEENTAKQLAQGLRSRRFIARKQINAHGSFDLALKARVLASGLSKEFSQLIVERGLKQQGDKFVWCSDKRLRLTSPYRFSPKQAEQLMLAIHSPMQLIYGIDGAEKVKRALSLYSDLLPNLTKYALAGGHHVHMEQAEQTAKLIDSFIQKHSN